jgi:hypothetical protein
VANDKRNSPRAIPRKPSVVAPVVVAEMPQETFSEAVADIPVEMPPVPEWKAVAVTPETATHAAVMTRGQAVFHRIGHRFTPDVVEIDLHRRWPSDTERASRIRSLVCESGPNGSLEVEFIRK